MFSNTSITPITKKPSTRKRILFIIIGPFILFIAIISYFSVILFSSWLTTYFMHSNFDSIYTLPSLTSSNRNDLFNKLTANTWCNKSDVRKSNMLADTYKNYFFNKNGTYKWTHFSDYLEGSGQGNWNFEVNSVNSGIIFLSSGDTFGFVVKYNRILLADEILEKCGAIEDNTKTYTASTLPEIDTSLTFKKLTESKWHITNRYDLSTLPTEIEFLNDGRYIENFDNGKCSQSGLWSLNKDQLYRENPIKNCQPDSGHFTKSSVKFDSELLILNEETYSH